MARYNISLVKMAKAMKVADKELRELILNDAEIVIGQAENEYERVSYDIELVNFEGSFYGKIISLAKQWSNIYNGKLDYSLFKNVKGYHLIGR